MVSSTSMHVHVVGIGMGNPDTLTLRAKRFIEESGLLIGGARLLEPFGYLACGKLDLYKPTEIVAALLEAQSRGVAVASVLVSGDVGFYSGATLLERKLDESGISYDVTSGISSLVYFCAAIHMPWQDMHLVSAHGRAHNAVGAMQSHARTFAITGGSTHVEDICTDLVKRGLGGLMVHAGERLSYEDERIVSGTADELSGMTFADLSVLVVENPHPIGREWAAPSLPDSAFERAKVPMTKEEVREVSISKLHIAPDHVVWDVGAGTGSISVEAALAANEGVVYAVEKNPDALTLLERNRTNQGLSNLVIVEGRAPEVLEDLPIPDRVFVGGSSGRMVDIFRIALEKNPLVRIVVTAITLETIADALEAAGAFPLENVDIVQMAVSRAKGAGAYHLMMGENPVYIISCDGSAEEV